MLRGLAGVLVGLGYCVLVGAVMLLLDRIAGDPNSGSLILDNHAIANFLILLAMMVTGAAGALVGLVVGLLGIGKARAAITGFWTGVFVLAVLLIKTWPQWNITENTSLNFFGFLLVLLLVLVILLPVGLAATGLMTSIVVAKLTSN